MITAREKQVLRELAAHQMELATTPRNQELVSLWLKHNACLDSRPTVYIEWGTFEQEVIPQLLRCENEEARQLEYALYANFIGQELFGDDSVVPDYMPVGVNTDVYKRQPSSVHIPIHPSCDVLPSYILCARCAAYSLMRICRASNSSKNCARNSIRQETGTHAAYSDN